MRRIAMWVALGCCVLGCGDQDKTLVAVTERSAAPLAGHGYMVARIKSWESWQELCRDIAKGNGASKGRDILVLDSLNALNDLCKHHIIKVARPALLQKAEKVREQIKNKKSKKE